jgi:hypothetical protein
MDHSVAWINQSVCHPMHVEGEATIVCQEYGIQPLYTGTHGDIMPPRVVPVSVFVHDFTGTYRTVPYLVLWALVQPLYIAFLMSIIVTCTGRYQVLYFQPG